MLLWQQKKVGWKGRMLNSLKDQNTKATSLHPSTHWLKSKDSPEEEGWIQFLKRSPQTFHNFCFSPGPDPFCLVEWLAQLVLHWTAVWEVAGSNLDQTNTQGL